MLSGLPLADCEFVAVDLETTGCSPGRNSIIEVGAVRLRDGVVTAEFSSLVRPRDVVPRVIVQLTGITAEMLATAPSIDEVIPAFRAFASGAVLVAHNYRFDLGFLDFEAERLWGEPFPRPAIDTLSMARRVYPGLERHSLLYLSGYLGTSSRPDHRAAHDASAAAEVLSAMLPELQSGGLTTVGDLAEFCGLSDQQALASRLPLTVRVPDAPGVYVFRDEQGAVLFVGRAKCLRGRVRGHFYPSSERFHSDLGRRVSAVRAIPIKSALDAALLERRLLARYDPPFNPPAQRACAVYLLHVDTGAPFPSVKVVTRRRARGEHVGPFTSRWSAATLADCLSSTYGLRMCTRRIDSRLAARECPNRDGICPAPCVREVDRAEYSASVRRLLAVFQGQEDDARSLLSDLQQCAASEARYEDAIRYRDGLRALDRGLGTLGTLRRATEHDAVLVERISDHVAVHLVRGGLRATVLRGTSESIKGRLPRALGNVYFDGRSRPDILSLTPSQVAELLIIASFTEGGAHVEVPVGDASLTLAGVRRCLGLDRRQPRRSHAAS